MIPIIKVVFVRLARFLGLFQSPQRVDSPAMTPEDPSNAPRPCGSQLLVLRALSAELRSLLDRVDAEVLQQAAVLAKVPTKPVKAPSPFKPSLAREVAYGRIVVPELGNHTERERMLQYRADMRERRQNNSLFDGWEANQQVAQFEKEERARWASAGEMLRRGVAPGHTAALCHLTEAEVQNIQDQLEGRTPPTTE